MRSAICRAEAGRSGAWRSGAVADDTDTKVVTLSTESIASTPQPQAGADARCESCGAPLARDQRYCLECGERRVPMSSVLRAGRRAAARPPPRPPARRHHRVALAGHATAPQRNATLTVIAGVGVLLLAMGVGVLIGRSGASKPSRGAGAGDHRG